MKPFFLVYKIVLISFFGQTLPVFADTIKLKNGDVLTGVAVSKDDKVLVFSTPYSVQFIIPLSDIAEHIGVAEDSAEMPVNLPKWSGIFNAGGEATRGNIDSKSFSVDAEVIKRSGEKRYTFGGLLSHKKTKDTLIASYARTYLKFDRFLTDRWYILSNASVQKDEINEVALLANIGLGTGYQIFDATDLSLSTEGGVVYISRNNQAGQDEAYPGMRLAIKYGQNIFGKRSHIFHEQEVLFSLKSDVSMTVLSKTGVRFPLLYGLNASTQFNYRLDGRPAEGRQRLDTSVIFSVGYKW